ncbi:MAG: helix-turn-helix transcriptional regulator [Clostridia bacterium]|nr:helix-turn-helix transcriptional regulator [Clostridia bacterium]
MGTAERIHYATLSAQLPAPFLLINNMHTAPGFRLDYQSHPYYHVNHVTDGSLTVRIGGQVVQITAGQTMILPPGIPHLLETDEGYRQIGMDIGEVHDERGLSDALSELTASGTPEHFAVTARHNVGCTYEQMVALLESPTRWNQLRAVNMAEAILLDALDRLRADTDDCEPFIRRFGEMLDAHGSGNLTLSDMCRHLCLSRTQLERLSARAFGCGASEYCARLRYAKVCSLLRTTEKTLAEIAAETDFCDAGHLSVFFRKRAGVTPGEYRRR